MSILEVYPPALRTAATMLDGVGASLSAAARRLPDQGGAGSPALDAFVGLSAAAAVRLTDRRSGVDVLASALVSAARAYEEADR